MESEQAGPAPAGEHRGIDAFYRLRGVTIAAFAVALLGALFGASRLEFDFTPQRIFESDDEEFAFLERTHDVFGRADDLLVVHVQTDDLFRPERVDYLRRLHAALAGIDGVAGVDDLTTVRLVRPGDLLPRPLLDDSRPLAAAREAALAHPLVAGRLVSADGGSALLAVRIEASRMALDALSPIVHACAGAIAGTATPAGVEAIVTGIPAARVYGAEGLIEDQVRFLPACSVLFLLLLWLVFRDARAVLLPVGAILLSVLYTVGLLGATGEAINIVNHVLPLLILVIGMADAIHVTAHYRRELARGRGQRQAVWSTVRRLAVACALTSVTTAIGFASLVVTDGAVLQGFGLYAAAGVMVAYLVTVGLLPVALSHLSPRLGAAAARVDARLDAATAYIGAWALRRPRAVLAGGAAVLAAAVWLGAGVEAENHLFEASPRGDPLVEANRRLERDFGGVLSATLVVQWDAGTDVLTPAALGYVRELQDLAAARGLRPFSLVDLVAEFEAARHRGDPAYRRLPSTAAGCRRAVDGLAAAAAAPAAGGVAALLGRVWAPADRMLQVFCLAPDAGSQAFAATELALRDRLDGDAARHAELGIRVRLSGLLPVAGGALQRLIADLFTSLLLAFAFILPIMCALLRSVRAGLISMIPNVLPLATTLAVMRLAGMDLEISSAVVFAIALGLAVDDTIHFMARFRHELHHDAGGDGAYERAVMRTFHGTGAAIVVTSVLLGVGFSVLLLSRFPITHTFALLMEVTVLAALAGDLVLLPALLVTLRPFGPGGRRGGSAVRRAAGAATLRA